jgi:hypothetical protein
MEFLLFIAGVGVGYKAVVVLQAVKRAGHF